MQNVNKEQLILLNLIEQSQFGFTKSISFADADIDVLYKEAMQHAVLSIVAPELPDEISNL